MGERTNIGWTDHTFNPWIGCSKVPGAEECVACYAERDMDLRLGRVQWGEGGTRSRTKEDYWEQPSKWNAQALAAGVRKMVFCASLADIFEEPQALPLRRQLIEWRAGLFDEVIDQTQHLWWQILTKRPSLVPRLMPRRAECTDPNCLDLGCRYRSNLWLGTSAGTEVSADSFVIQLLGLRELAPVLFVSCEPMLDRVDFTALRYGVTWVNALTGRKGVYHPLRGTGPSIDWLIVGVESARNRRVGRLGEFATEAAWWDHARKIVGQCAEAGVPCFIKQGPRRGFVVTDPGEFPAGEWPRQFPSIHSGALQPGRNLSC